MRTVPKSVRYLGKEVNREIPQQRKVLRDGDLKGFVKRATTFLGINLEGVEGRRRVRESEKEDRDLLIYLLWEDGRYRGQEIGDMFGLGYSSVSRRAGMIKVRMSQDESFGRKVNKLKSIIKI
jgi:chromosomal replication initiation ATPase DnaA